MADRGVELSAALAILSASQVLTMCLMFFIRKLDDKIKDKNKVLQLSFVLRTFIVALMLFVDSPILFVILFLLYTLAAAPNIMFEGLVAQWSSEKNIDFSKIRYFASTGFACGGLIAGFIFSITGEINSILIYIVAVHSLNAIGTFAFPIKIPKLNKDIKDKTTIKLKKEYKVLIVLTASVMVFPNVFGFILNSHYRDVFGQSVEQAIFLAGVALFFGAFLSEVTGFVIVNKLIARYGPKKVILFSMILSLTRWILALFAPNAAVFTATYIFHGLSFSFGYIGIITYIKSKVGNEYTNKLVIEYVLYSFFMSVIMTQIVNFILNNFTNNALLIVFVILNISIVSIYYFLYLYKKPLIN